MGWLIFIIAACIVEGFLPGKASAERTPFR